MRQLKTIFIVFVILFISACGSKNKESGSTPYPKDSPSVSKSSDAPKNSPTIIGLYLGMDSHKLWKVVSEDWKTLNGVGAHNEMYHGVPVPEGLKSSRIFSEADLNNDGEHQFRWDKGYVTVRLNNGKVTYIDFERNFLKYLNGFDYTVDDETVLMKVSQIYKFTFDLKKVRPGTYAYIDFINGWSITRDDYGSLVLEIYNK